MITKQIAKNNVTLNISNKPVVVDIDDYNNDLKVLVDAYNANNTDENMAAILEQIEKFEDVNRIEPILNGEVKHYINRDEYYFMDDDQDAFDLSEEVVLDLECFVEAGADITPIINFLKNLRKSPNYSAEFAEQASKVILSTFSNEKIFNKLVNKGFYTEVAYLQSNVNKFTLTNDGLVVAYKRADFKRHKFDVKTGERIDRFPFVYDEETGEKIITYPSSAEEYKIFLDSKTADRLSTRNEENKYISVGQIVDQRDGKEGFEEQGQSLIFKGTPVTESDIYVKVLIHPQFIKNFNTKFDSIITPVFYVTEFVQDGKPKPSSATASINTKELHKFAKADWKAYNERLKAEVIKSHEEEIKTIDSVSKL